MNNWLRLTPVVVGALFLAGSGLVILLTPPLIYVRAILAAVSMGVGWLVTTAKWRRSEPSANNEPWWSVVTKPPHLRRMGRLFSIVGGIMLLLTSLMLASESFWMFRIWTFIWRTFSLGGGVFLIVAGGVSLLRVLDEAMRLTLGARRRDGTPVRPRVARTLEEAPDGPSSGNMVYRSAYRSGLIGMLAGESLSKALDRTLLSAAADGQRLVFMVRDRWSIWQWLRTILVFIVTLGLVGRGPSYLLITEPTPGTKDRSHMPRANR